MNRRGPVCVESSLMALTCWRIRRRLSPHLDGALSEKQASAVARHLAGCPGCRGEAARLERMRARVREALLAVPEPDWAAFWDGVRRQIVAGPAPRRRWGGLPWPLGLRPRLALGGALAGLLVLGGVLWRQGVEEPRPMPSSVVVKAVETADPEDSVMIFASPEDEMTIIWVFGSDQLPDRSWLAPRGFAQQV